MRMNAELWLRRVFPYSCLLASVGPLVDVSKWIRARKTAVAFTGFGVGPLPEVPISVLDYLALGCALVLSVAAILAFLRRESSAPIALAATVGLWFYFIPGLWDQLSGEMRFATWMGKSVEKSWQMVVYQCAVTGCSVFLSHLWYRERKSRPAASRFRRPRQSTLG